MRPDVKKTNGNLCAYEWLLQEQLDLPDAVTGAYALVIDPERQWAIAGSNSTRHRVKNNLSGTPDFCPMIFRTPELNALVNRNLAAQARALVADIPADLLARTAAFLLLKDSRSSFEIEGEDPPQVLHAPTPCLRSTEIIEISPVVRTAFCRPALTSCQK